MDASTARRLQGADLGGEILALGPGHAGVADQDRFRCVMLLLLSAVWQPVCARPNPLLRLGPHRRRTNDRGS